MSENAEKIAQKKRLLYPFGDASFLNYAVLILRNFALNRLRRILIAKNSAYAKYTEFQPVEKGHLLVAFFSY